MEEDKNAFYVVRKGDVIGIYRNFSDFQAEFGSSVLDPPLSVYKGYSLSEEARAYLASHGLRNAVYSISARDVKDDIFGSLQLCPFQPPVSESAELLKGNCSTTKVVMLGFGATMEVVKSSSYNHQKRRNLGICMESDNAILSSDCQRGTSRIGNVSCILKFDGASKRNPGPAGAGAVLRAEDGSLICRLHEGIGIATNNVAEYRGLILGLKYALRKGFKHIQVFGDSNLVCMQVQGLWRTKNQNMADLCKEAKELVSKFLSFQITHVVRELNAEADAQANLGIDLRAGQVVEEAA